MKMTVEFDDRLVRAARARAAVEGETLEALIERAVSDYVQGANGGSRSIDLLTKCGKPVPGVNVDDRVQLHDRMDARD